MPFAQRAVKNLYAICKRCGSEWLACELPCSAEIAVNAMQRECPKCSGATTTIEIKAI